MLLCCGQVWKHKAHKVYFYIWESFGSASLGQGGWTHTFFSSFKCNMHPHPSALCRDHIHSCLSQAKSKTGAPSRHGEHDILYLLFPPDSPWFLSPWRHPACLHNLLESTACHKLGLLACHGADQPRVAATWHPVWQLTSITVTHLHSSFLRPHHNHDL